MSLLRSDRAAPPRTLVAILRETATQWPDDPAVDSGADVLTYSEMLEAAEAVALELNRAGVGGGDRVGIRIPSGTSELYVAIVGVLLIVLGVAALVYQGVTYTSRETVIDIGPVHATAERERTLPLPPLVGIAVVAGGVALLVAGMRKRS